MDASLDQIATLHPKLREIATQAYNKAVQSTPIGVHPIITQGYRTFAESDKLYQQGRTTPGEIVSNAKAGQSFHDYGLAVDICILINGQEDWTVNDNWMQVVNIFKGLGFEWGGDWHSIKDNPHLQMSYGYTWQQLLEKYNNKDYISGTEYVNI